MLSDLDDDGQYVLSLKCQTCQPVSLSSRNYAEINCDGNAWFYILFLFMFQRPAPDPAHSPVQVLGLQIWTRIDPVFHKVNRMKKNFNIQKITAIQVQMSITKCSFVHLF